MKKGCRISAVLSVFVIVFSVSGCSIFGGNECTVDQQEVQKCRRILEAHASKSDAKSALSSLKREYNEYKNGDESCERFKLFFDRHIEPVCNKYRTASDDAEE